MRQKYSIVRKGPSIISILEIFVVMIFCNDQEHILIITESKNMCTNFVGKIFTQWNLRLNPWVCPIYPQYPKGPWIIFVTLEQVYHCLFTIHLLELKLSLDGQQTDGWTDRCGN